MLRKSLFVVLALLSICTNVIWQQSLAVENTEAAPKGLVDELIFDYQLLNEVDKLPVLPNTKLKVGERYILLITIHGTGNDINTENETNLELNQGLSFVENSLFIGSSQMPMQNLPDSALKAIYPEFPNKITLPLMGLVNADLEIYEQFTVQVDDVTGAVDIPGIVTGYVVETEGNVQFPPKRLSFKESNYIVDPIVEMNMSVNASEAKVGDILTYTLSAKNIGGRIEESNFTTILSPEVECIPHSTKINKQSVEDDSNVWNQKTFNYTVPTYSLNEEIELSYQVEVTQVNENDVLEQQFNLNGKTLLDSQSFDFQSNLTSTKLIQAEGAPVTIKYLDQTGSEIHEVQMIYGKVGDTYDGSTDTYKLTIEGYTLDESTLPENAKGTISSSAQVVTYIYLQDSKAEESTDSTDLTNNSHKKSTENSNNMSENNQSVAKPDKLPKTGEIRNKLFFIAGIILLIALLLYKQMRVMNKKQH